ncbi:MAG: GAF domain-containing protein [Actinobacteria bacterium]|nr:MAG: GAF domain-containing protein [Actinomycetota bacterium]
MAVRPGHRETRPGGAFERSAAGVDALAAAGVAAARASTLTDALQPLADALARAAAADVVIVRIREDDHQLRAVAVATRSPAVAAELEATRVPVSELEGRDGAGIEALPVVTRRAAERLRATVSLVAPIMVASTFAGTIELLRAGESFDDADRSLAALAAAQAALAVRAFGDDRRPGAAGAGMLSLAGEALVAVTDEDRAPEHVTRLAVEATGALAGLLWRSDDDGPVVLTASFGLGAADAALVDAGEAAGRALRASEPVAVERDAGRLPRGAGIAATLQLGHPPIGALQLLFASQHPPSDDELDRLLTFGVRAAQALRAGRRARTMAAELDRTRALLSVVGQAISQLSLAHTLETAIVSVGELLGVERLAVYLRQDGRLVAAAGLGLAGPHVRVGERLLELALGPFRGRGVAAFADVTADPKLASVADAPAEAGIQGAVAVPLAVRVEPIGLLAVFPPLARSLTTNETSLLSALATQLAVAVQNAQLHEQATRLGDERERALESERASARQLRALYEISRSFAQSLSLDATLEAVARTVTEVLDVDVAVIRMPDARQEALEARALSITDARAEDAVRTVVGRREPFGQPWQRLFRLGESFRLTPSALEQIGPPAVGMIPFVERGWSGVAVPIATTADVVAALTIVSLRPDAPISADTIARAEAIAGQAALAIDNARLYQQQKEFADTMQRSLLPRSVPELAGLEVGDAYQSSARVEVGGDVYDFVALDDGRLAVVLGDVTGHGIEAAADMAMAKFVFRSLAREHPEPNEFLAAANDVVVGEIAPGKFITMVYLVIDGATGAIVGAGAGHPPPRVVTPGGDVNPLEVRGLVLGIEPGQTYAEQSTSLEVGGAVVLYTDGVLEARHEGELYGFERLDAIVAAGRHLSAQDLAETILADCRDFAKNELADDCAVVVIKRVEG